MNKDLLNVETMIECFLEKYAKSKEDLEKFSTMLHDGVESAVADFIEVRLEIDPDSDVGDYDPVW